MIYLSNFGTLSEDVPVGAIFPPSETVTVVVKDMATGATVTIGSGATSEITINSTSSLYVWNTSQITTQPTTFKNYAVVFTSSAGAVAIQKIVKGGATDFSALADYDGSVHIDTVDGTAGTAYPTGTSRKPVSNYADALTIAAALGLKSFHLSGSITLTQNHVGWHFESVTSALTDTIALAGFSVNNSSFEELTISGAAGGSVPKNITFNDCRASAITGFDGVMFGGGLLTSLGLASTGTALMRGTKFLTVGGTINANGCNNISWSEAAGLVTVTNFTNAGGYFLLNGQSIQLTLAASCTAGILLVGGDGILVNNSAMTVLFDEFRNKAVDQGLAEDAVVAQAAYVAQEVENRVIPFVVT